MLFNVYLQVRGFVSEKHSLPGCHIALKLFLLCVLSCETLCVHTWIKTKVCIDSSACSPDENAGVLFHECECDTGAKWTHAQ